MKVLLAILLCVIPAFALKDTIKSSGKWSTLTWSTGSPPTTSDTVYKTAVGTYNDTMDADYTIVGFVADTLVAGTHWRDGYNLTVTGPLYKDNGTGTRHYGNMLGMTANNGDIYISTTLGTMTVTLCSLVVSGNRDTITLRKSLATEGDRTGFKHVNIGFANCTTWTVGVPIYAKNYTIGTGNVAGASGLFAKPTASGWPFKISGTAPLLYTGPLRLNGTTANVIDTIDTINAPNIGSSGWWAYDQHTSGTNIHVYIGKLNMPSVTTCRMLCAASGTGRQQIKFLCDSIIMSSVSMGAITNPGSVSCGSTVFKLGSLEKTTFNGVADTHKLETSTWNIAGNVTYGPNHVPIPGASTFNFVGAGAQTITTANTNAFYDININRTTAGTCTFADTLKAHNVTVASTNTQAVSCSTIVSSGNINFAGSSNLTLRCCPILTAPTSTLSFANTLGTVTKGANAQAYFTDNGALDDDEGVELKINFAKNLTSTGTASGDTLIAYSTTTPCTLSVSGGTHSAKQRKAKGATLVFPAISLSALSVDSIGTLKTLDTTFIDSLINTDSTVMSLASNKGFKVRVWDTAAINGISGKKNYYFASNGPTVARLYLPSAKTVSHTDWAFINSVAYPVNAANGTNFDGGGTVNFLWPSTGMRRMKARAFKFDFSF